MEIYFYRAVLPEDKSVSIAVTAVVLCAFAFIPGPILHGTLVGEELLRSDQITIVTKFKCLKLIFLFISRSIMCCVGNDLWRNW